MDASLSRNHFRKTISVMATKRQTAEILIGKAILCAEFAPFEWCANLIAVATKEIIFLHELRFPESDPSLGPSRCILVDEIDLGKDFNCRILSFSPKTDVTIAPKIIGIACADNNKSSYRYYVTDKPGSFVNIDCHELGVNDIAIEPSTGRFIASVGDDLKCVISTLDNRVKCTYPLQSPGTSVVWHRSVEGKVLIAEKQGIITLYDTNNNKAERSFDSHIFPLMCVKWCPGNSSRICGIAGKNWFLWDMKKTSQPAEEGELAHQSLRFRFSLTDQDTFAVRSAAGTDLTIMLKNVGALHFNDVPAGNTISFHARLNFLAVDGMNKLYIIRVFG